ncbi:hypothetical protein AXF42_Ash010068 [Apostasia shenzhenica]|uniref:Membrane protein YuiD n=1 Tax=Apostasia shenzhenica TaxID=1088818 RepID=A0A2I0ACR2_9ASPA|nr:hypothetical protein AXF42_Ash010068 [Apostasia shenzhenica]
MAAASLKPFFAQISVLIPSCPNRRRIIGVSPLGSCSNPQIPPKNPPISLPDAQSSKSSAFGELESRADAPTCLVLPVLNSVGGFVRSCVRGGAAGGEHFDGDYVCGGSIGTLLMSTTAAAVSKARASPFLCTLTANPTFVSGFLAWAVAQMIKVALNFFVERRFDLGILFSCGGMPSSHSSLCMALTASVAFWHGVGDSLFPVCLGFSLIVMYDAIGVRRHAGMQAEYCKLRSVCIYLWSYIPFQVLNKIVEDLFQGHPMRQRKLKEILGHTPLQVVAGALLGILVAYVCCQNYVAI